MKKILSFLLAAPLMMAVLTGCSTPKGETDQDIVERVGNLATLVIDNGGQLKEAGKTYQTEFNDSFLALKQYPASEENPEDLVLIEWSDNTEKQKVTYAKDPKNPDRTKITPKYPLQKSEEFLLELTATVTYNEAVTTRLFKFWIVSDTVEVLTLQQLREKISNGTASTDANYSFNGIVTGYMEPSDSHLYSGVYVQDGPWAMMLYAGKMSSMWDYDNWTIGTRLHVIGKLSPYNGLNELKPSLVELAPNDAQIATPTTLSITQGSQYGTTQLLGQDGRLVEIKGAKFVKTETLKVGSHANMTFSLDGVNITFRVNYHIGETAYKALIDVASTLKAGDTVNLYGVVSWFNAPQISPQFIDGRTPAQCIEIVK
jgi:hypothetical protein